MRFNRCAIFTEGGRVVVGETQTSRLVTQPSRSLHRSLTRLQKNILVSVAPSLTYPRPSPASDFEYERGENVNGIGGEFSLGGLKTVGSLAWDASLAPNA